MSNDKQREYWAIETPEGALMDLTFAKCELGSWEMMQGKAFFRETYRCQ